MMSYHNTCGIENTAEYERKAISQDEVIMRHFRNCAYGTLYSPSKLNKWVLRNAPITSVRRSLTGLTKAGLLVKTDMMVDGLYGRPESLWKLAEPVQGILL